MKKANVCRKRKNVWSYLVLLISAGILYVMNGAYVLLLPIWLLLCVLIFGLLLCTAGGRKLSFSMETKVSEETDDPVRKLQIKNASVIPVFHGALFLTWKNTLTGEMGEHRISFAALPGMRTEEEVRLPVRYCGAYQIRAEQIYIYDIFSIFRAKRKADLQAEFLIYPKTEQLDLPLAQTDVYDMESFRYSEQKSGDDANETFAIREYRAGDRIRNIHWKLTGKLDQVMIRESSYPVFHSILLLLETGYRETVPEAKLLDAAMSVYLSAAEFLLEQQKPFEIGYYDQEKQLFCVERVEHSEELWNLIPELLRAGRGDSEQSAYEQYQLWYGDQKYAHYIYVTAEAGYEIPGRCVSHSSRICRLERETQDAVEVISSVYESTEQGMITVLQIEA